MPANSILLCIQHAVVDQSQKKKTIDTKSKGLEGMLCYIKHKQEKSKINFMTLPGSKLNKVRT